MYIVHCESELVIVIGLGFYVKKKLFLLLFLAAVSIQGLKAQGEVKERNII